MRKNDLYRVEGNAFNEGIDAGKKQFEKRYLASKRKVSAICVAISLIISFSVSTAVKAILFSGAYVPQTRLRLVEVQLPIGNALYIIGAAVIIFLGIFGLFGKSLFTLINKKDKERALQRYELDRKVELGVKSERTLKIVASLGLVLGLCFSVFSATDNIGFYDDRVKYSAQTLGIVTVPYEELEIYYVQGKFDDNGNFEKFDGPAYAVADKDGNYYELGIVNENGETQRRIKKIIKDYNKQVKEIKTANELDK